MPEHKLKRINLLIQACNLTCPMCSMNVNNKEIGQVLIDYPGATKGPQLNLEEYKKFFEQLKPLKPAVSISGGEPMLFRHMTELIEYLKYNCEITVGMTTNGTLFNADKLERISRAASSITVSIDGLKEKHDEIRGKGNFDITINNINSLLELKNKGIAKSQIASLFCLHEGNYTSAEETADYLLGEIGIEHLTISFVIFSTIDTLKKHTEWVRMKSLPEYMDIKLTRGGYSSRADFSRLEFEEIFNIKERLKSRYKNIRFEPDFKSIQDIKKYFLTDDVMDQYFATYCRPSFSSMTLISNGDVLFYPQCFQIKLGNIRNDLPINIWNSDKYTSIRKALSKDLSPVCAHCCANRVEKSSGF